MNLEVSKTKKNTILSSQLTRLDITSRNISEKIFAIIGENEIDTKDKTYGELKELILIYLAKLIQRRKDLNLLNSYFNDDKILKENKLIWKIEKNIMIYLPILIKHINDNINRKTDEEIKAIIKETFNKLLKLLFIYGDKTSLSLFSESLRLDITDLKRKEEDFIENQRKLQENEDKIKMKLKYNNKGIIVNDLFSRTYRTIVEKTDEKCIIDSTQSREKIMNQIAEKELLITYNGLYDLFIKTLELNIDLELRLNEIKEAFILLFGLINSFKEIGVLSSDFLILENKKHDNTFFKSFIDGIETNNLDLNEFISKIGREKPKTKSEKAKKKITDEEFLKIKLHGLNHELWLNFSTKQKYTFFINNVLGLENGNIKITRSLSFGSQSIKILISEFIKEYNYDKDYVEEKIEFFKSRKKFVLFDLIKTDLDSFIFLYNWFEFLVFRGDGKKRNRIKKPNFLKDIISDLKEKNEIEGNEYLNLKGDLYNLSAVSIGKQIEFLFRDLSRGNFQIAGLNIGKVSFKNNVSLYSKSDKADIGESLDYLNIAINACISILNGRKLSVKQLNYIIILQELGILPDNLNKIKISDRDNLINLIMGLKIVKGKIEKLKEMQEVSKNDLSIVQELFSQVGITDSNYDIRTGNKIGPEKDFGRILVKLIKNYNGDFHKIGDLNRFRLIGEIGVDNENSMEQLIKKIFLLNSYNGVKSVSFENDAGHLLSNPDKKTAYRDFKANILLSSGNLVEVQLHFKEMIEIKAGDFDLDSSIKYALEKGSSLLTSVEVDEFIKIYQKTFKEFPSQNLILNISNLNEQQLREFELGFGQINCDKIYKITRGLDLKKSLASKLTMLERTLFNNEWAGIVTRILSKMGIKFKNDNVIKK